MVRLLFPLPPGRYTFHRAEEWVGKQFGFEPEVLVRIAATPFLCAAVAVAPCRRFKIILFSFLLLLAILHAARRLCTQVSAAERGWAELSLGTCL